MRIIQLPVFTGLVSNFLSDLEFWKLQEILAERPDSGSLIPGGRGLRKFRWASKEKGRGKRGGLRVIYYWRPNPALLCFVTIYAKSRNTELTARQLKQLATAARRELP